MKPSLFRLGNDGEKAVVKIFTQQNTRQKLPVIQSVFVDVIAGKMGFTLLFEPVEVGDKNGGISILAIFASISRELSSSL